MSLSRKMKTVDVPAPRRRCYGLAPGAPCPALDDGTWPEGCDCCVEGAKMKGYDGSIIVAVMWIVALTVASIAILLWLLFGKAFGADVDCLSKEQARAKFPNQIIYWHTINHCWDNVPVKVAHARKTNKLPDVDASGNAIRRRAAADVAVVRPQLPAVYYPTLMQGGGTTSDMLIPGSMTTWPLVADFDTEPTPFLPWQRVSALLNR